MGRYLLLLVPCLVACATGTTAQWRAGASVVDKEQVTTPKNKSEVQVFLKREFGAFEETESERQVMCATTTLLRRARILDGAAAAPEPPDRDWEVVAHLTTEEFPHDPKESEIKTDSFSSLFGTGEEPLDLFEMHLDGRFREDALDRLRYFAARLGADAVIDVYATGEAEYHMWEGDSLSFSSSWPSSPIWVNAKLLGFTLRDVRLHGTAVRYVD